MPFSFPEVERETGVPFATRNVPFLDWLGNRFEFNLGTGVGKKIWDWGYEGLVDNSPLMAPEEANRLYSIPEAGFTFDQPVREDRAKAMFERKERELLIRSMSQSVSHGNFSAKAIATFPAALIAQLSDPLELAINAIPFVGSGKQAMTLAKLGGPVMAERLFERGVIVSAETLAKNIRYPVLGARLIDATAGNILAEIPVLIQNRRDKADYDLSDSLLNIGLGSLMAGGIHAFTRSFGAVRDVVSKASPQTHDAAIKEVMTRMVKGEDATGAERIYGLDRKVHLEQTRFDETVAIRKALESPEIREAIQFEAMSAASDVLNKVKVGDVEGAFTAARTLPLVRDVLGAKLDLGNTIATLKQAIAALPDVGRIEVDGRTLNQWIESLESGKSVEPTQFQKRSAEQLEQIAQMKRVPEKLRQAAREAAETRRLNEDFAPGSPAERSYTAKVQQFVEQKRRESNPEEVRQAKVVEERQFQASLPKLVSEQDLKDFAPTKPTPEKPKAESGGDVEATIETVAVKVMEMRNGKPVSGTIDMSPEAAVKGLSERLKVLKSLADCLKA